MFSTKTYLALLIIMELSGKDRKSPLTSIKLAKQYNISKRYLEVIFGNLSKIGLISSRRGIGGGYSLACDLERISLYDLAVAAEGGIKLFAAGEFLPEKGERAITLRAVNLFWNNLEDELFERMKSYKLSDLVEELADRDEMYYI